MTVCPLTHLHKEGGKAPFSFSSHSHFHICVDLTFIKNYHQQQGQALPVVTKITFGAAAQPVGKQLNNCNTNELQDQLIILR